jgi:large subunit ribosomal protein L18e
MVTEHKNTQLQELIQELKIASAEAPVWRAVALHLERPTRHRVIVNLGSLNRYTKQGETVVVPGKVLGDGELDHGITVAALGFSSSAETKLKQSKASMLTIKEILKKDPKGKAVRIIA